MVAARLMPNLLDAMEPSGSPDEGQNGIPPRQRTTGLRPGRRRDHSGRHGTRSMVREDTEVIDFCDDFVVGSKPGPVVWACQPFGCCVPLRHLLTDPR